MNHTPQTFAALLDGREIGEEITREEEALAKASGLVVVFGAHDDMIHFRGVLHDEIQGYTVNSQFVSTWGVMPESHDCNCEYCGHSEFLRKLKADSREIKTFRNKPEYSCVHETEIPHATFEILWDGHKYCRGIVFAIDLLGREVAP